MSGHCTRNRNRGIAAGNVPGGIQATRFVGGRLLYLGIGHVVYGTDAFDGMWGGASKESPLIVCGDVPCWIDWLVTPQTNRVIWGRRKGTSYPPRSIGELIDADGKPGYLVNHVGPHKSSVGFAVIDETEGPRYEEVSALAMSDGVPIYRARIGDHWQKIIWKAETLVGSTPET